MGITLISLTSIFSESAGRLFIKNFKFLPHSIGGTQGAEPPRFALEIRLKYRTPIRFFGIPAADSDGNPKLPVS